MRLSVVKKSGIYHLWGKCKAQTDHCDADSWAWTHGHRGEQGNEFVDHTLNETMDLLESKHMVR